MIQIDVRSIAHLDNDQYKLFVLHDWVGTFTWGDTFGFMKSQNGLQKSQVEASCIVG